MKEDVVVEVSALSPARGVWYGAIESESWSYSLRVYGVGRFSTFDSRRTAEAEARRVAKSHGWIISKPNGRKQQ